MRANNVDSERMRQIAESSLKIHVGMAQSGSVVATVTEEARRLIPAHQAIGISVVNGDWPTGARPCLLIRQHTPLIARQ